MKELSVKIKMRGLWAVHPLDEGTQRGPRGLGNHGGYILPVGNAQDGETGRGVKVCVYLWVWSDAGDV